MQGFSYYSFSWTWIKVTFKIGSVIRLKLTQANNIADAYVHFLYEGIGAVLDFFLLGFGMVNEAVG